MRSYLSLIPISARLRRKQSRMILICIVLAVFLVTAIFSLAEAGLKMETAEAVDKAGYWHILLKGISESDAKEISARPDVEVNSWYDVINLDDNLNMDKDYYIEGVRTALCGIEEPFITDIMHYFSDDAHVVEKNEIVLTENAGELLDVHEGDFVTLNTPAGDYDFVVSGFRISGNGKYVTSNGGVTSALLVKSHQAGAFINIDTFRDICSANKEAGSPKYYIRFREHTNLKRSIAEIKEQYGLSDSETELNTIFMASKGISNRAYIQNVYTLAAVLFLLILAAGVMMISSSMNSNVAQRMQFFGMLRCIGASRQQIIRYVRLEALNWCRSAVPAGILLGVMVTWSICGGLKYMIGGEFVDMPVFVLSPTGILSGGLVGIITVFLAAQSPAKRAAKASPVAAASGSAGDEKNIKHGVTVRFGKVETALGIHHAVSAKKNLFLMTGSFAISIILFLCFSVLIEFVECLLPQKLSSPDIDIMSADSSNSLDPLLAENLEEIDGVAHVFGRRVCFDFPAEIPGISKEGAVIDLMSYDDYQLELLVKDKDLRKGSSIEDVYGDSHQVLAIWDRDMPLEMGDEIRINGEKLKIAGLLKYSPFSNDGGSGGKITIIASEETFVRLTGVTDYAVIDVQLERISKEGRDGVFRQIRGLSGENQIRDRQDENGENIFWAFMVFVYGFIGIIALIALLNIMNSISMSVSARINQYGAMRAAGMGIGQITNMIAAESFTYGIFGCVAGCAVGLPLSKWMYDYLITSHFYYFTWQMPTGQLVIVVTFVFAAAVAAVYAPAKRIRDMEITEAINEL